LSQQLPGVGSLNVGELLLVHDQLALFIDVLAIRLRAAGVFESVEYLFLL
jgi:hypothetical protein